MKKLNRTSKGRRRTLIGLVAASALVLAACGSGSDTGNSSDTGSSASGSGGADNGNKEPWKVGIVTSFTGPANALGLEEIVSYRLAADLVNKAGGINGRKVEIIEDDDESQPQQAVTVINKQISSDKVVGIVGGLSTGASLAVKPIIEKQKVPLMVAAVGNAITVDNPKYVFRSTINDRLANSWLLDYINEHDMKRLAIIHDSNANGTGSADTTKELIKEKGLDIELVAEKTFDTNDTDMRAQLTALGSAKPDVIFVIGTNPGPALIIKQAHELGLPAQLVGSTGILSPKTIEVAGTEAAEGLVVPGLGSAQHIRPEQQPFVDAFKAAYNREPQGFEWLGDGMYLMLKGLEHVEASPNELDKAREQLRDAIESQTKDITWSSGPFNYGPDNHEGVDERTIVPMTVRNGEFVPIESR